VRRLLAILLTGAVGCSAFSPPTAEDFRQLRLAPAPRRPDLMRYRVQMSVDSPWLAGEFDGVVLAHEGRSPMARAQFFGDVGSKALDLVALPDRVVGFFPQAREGVDCRLPSEAAPHPLLFLGVSLLEDFADVEEDRVLGVRPDPEGRWLDLKPVVPGMRSEALRGPDGRTLERRFRWMYGIEWRERWERPDECRIRAKGLAIRVRVLEAAPLEKRPGRAFELEVPTDVRLAEGSRK
jgi:hypothetical protein